MLQRTKKIRFPAARFFWQPKTGFILPQNMFYDNVYSRDPQKYRSCNICFCLMLKSQMISGIDTSHDNRNGKSRNHQKHHKKICSKETKCYTRQQGITTGNCCNCKQMFPAEFLLTVLYDPLVFYGFCNQPHSQAEKDGCCNFSLCVIVLRYKIPDR